MTITFLHALVRRCQAKLNTLLGTFFLCLEKSILHIRLALLPLAHFVKQKNLLNPSPKRLNEREKNNFYDYGNSLQISTPTTALTMSATQGLHENAFNMEQLVHAALILYAH